MTRTTATVAERVPVAPLDLGLAIGALAGGWRIEDAIATGSYGFVYAARHQILGDRRAAIKVLRRELADHPPTVQRFLDEARAISRLDHPAIIDVLDVGRLSDGRPWILMELLARDNLAQRLAATGALTVAEALALLEPLVDALGCVHAAGLVHRDVTARNIGFAIDRSGDHRLKLFDFGIVKSIVPGDPAIATRRLGTPCAMAPEQIRGDAIDPRADVYALGVLVFQLVTGRYPFDADDPDEVERMHLETPPPRASAFAPVPAAIDAAIARAMAKRPDDRPPTARALLDELASAAGARR